MKKTQFLLIFILLTGQLWSQDNTTATRIEKPHFATIDTVHRSTGTFKYEGVFNVDFENERYLYDNGKQYWFRITADKIKQAYSTILQVELSSPENGQYEKMGDIFCSEIHAPSTKPDVLNPGLYVDAWGFKQNIEIWYNGDFIKLVYPAVITTRFASLEHSFYIKAADYKIMLNAFKPQK